MSLRKNINKLLIGAVIGSTVVGVGALALQKDKKSGKSFWDKATSFFQDGITEMNKSITGNKGKKTNEEPTQE